MSETSFPPDWLERQAAAAKRHTAMLPEGLRDETPTARSQHRAAILLLTEGPEMAIALSKLVHDMADARGLRVRHDIGMQIVRLLREMVTL